MVKLAGFQLGNLSIEHLEFIHLSFHKASIPITFA